MLAARECEGTFAFLHIYCAYSVVCQSQTTCCLADAWEQTDDVKTLRRKLLLSSVLAERERQIAVNVEHAHLAQQQDAAFLAQRSKALQVGRA